MCNAHLSWINCWFAHAASVCAKLAVSETVALHILKSRLVSFCLWQDKEKPFPSCLPLLHLQMWNTGCSGEGCTPAFSTCGFDILVQHLSINMYFKNRKKQPVVLLSWTQLKKIFMWILLCFYNPIWFFFLLSFEQTGPEGKLGWTKDHPSSSPGCLRLVIEISNRRLRVKPIQVFCVSSWSEQFTCWIKKTLHLKPVYLSNTLPLWERVGVVGPDCTCCPDMVWAGCDIQEQMDGCNKSETQIRKGNFFDYLPLRLWICRSLTKVFSFSYFHNGVSFYDQCCV